jgi:uncharacterized protein
MEINTKDKEYLTMVNYILENEEFNKIGKYYHHGTNRLRHSLRVSYFSYKIAKKLGLDYKIAARAGLLHDFYATDDGGTIIEFIKSQIEHPKTAANNSINHFEITDKEKNIIETHMFPLTPKPSKYLEGWVVSFVDKGVGTYEYTIKFKYQFSMWLIIIFNFLTAR